MSNSVSVKRPLFLADMTSKKQHQSQMRLYGLDGSRLYLNEHERRELKSVAGQLPEQQLLFCLFLLYTGCRLSEGRNIRICDVQRDGIVAIRCLKKQEVHQIREVPIPKPFAIRLIQYSENGLLKSDQLRLWPISRSTAWRWIKTVMQRCAFSGKFACPKGLRHSFGIHATMHNVPIQVIQKWMGHSDMRTTAIYSTASGSEERELASRMWK